MIWEDLSAENLKRIARFYNKDIKIAGISKLKKAEIIMELKKHLELNPDGQSVSHKQTKKPFKLLVEEKKPKPVKVKRVIIK